MIDSVAGSYMLPNTPTARVWTNADSSNVLGYLTPDDWALAAQAAGQTLSEDSQAQPLILWQIANDRKNGVLGSNQPVTVDYLRRRSRVAVSNPGVMNQFNRAIAYLEANHTGEDAGAAPTSRLDLLL